MTIEAVVAAVRVLALIRRSSDPVPGSFELGENDRIHPSRKERN